MEKLSSRSKAPARNNHHAKRRPSVKYSIHWDLSTIPEDVFKSEIGRRTRPQTPNLKLEPCIHCGTALNARQRRRACISCGKRQSEPVHSLGLIKAVQREGKKQLRKVLRELK